MRASLVVIASAIASLMPWGGVSAQSANEFYHGRQITIIVGSDAGAGYDAYARLLSRHLGVHIPGNPNFIVQNMPGGGSMAMMNQMTNISPKDGTVIGAPEASAVFERMFHLLSPDGGVAHFDSTKLNWLGTIAQEVNVLIAKDTASAKSIQDLKMKEFVDAAAGPNTDGALVVRIADAMLGLKMKVVTGYAGATGELLAVERGEVDGAGISYGTALALRPDILSGKNYKILLQAGEAPHPDLKNVPFLDDLVPNQDDRALLELIFAKFMMGKPYLVTEGVPADRVELLRTAFSQTMSDREFLADAKKNGLEISPVDGVGVQSLVEKLYSQPTDLVVRARTLLHPQ